VFPVSLGRRYDQTGPSLSTRTIVSWARRGQLEPDWGISNIICRCMEFAAAPRAIRGALRLRKMDNVRPITMFECRAGRGNMKIRSAEASDLATVVACEDLAFNSSARTTRNANVSPQGELALQICQGEIHVIAAASRFLGYISFSLKHDHLFVAAIAVLPKYHRAGAGSRLLSHAESTAARLGLSKVHLFTDGKNSGNLNFYERHGYNETGRCEEGEFFRVYLSKVVGAASNGIALSSRNRTNLSAA
jgi:ribosomal protein S18 acetylase RimI-like enzyme